MRPFDTIVILTGAGLSAESGLGTFRDVDGLWTRYDLNEVATPQGFARNPELVDQFYNERRAIGLKAEPNAAHFALAELESKHPGRVVIVTQNIDHLHEAAGSKSVIHMHGELARALCEHCGESREWRENITRESKCVACWEAGGLRPDVVWFGEMPYRMEEIDEHLRKADLFISIGTSGTVFPAAGFVAEAGLAGAHTVELNLEPSQSAGAFTETCHGPATEIVPRYVGSLLAAK